MWHDDLVDELKHEEIPEGAITATELVEKTGRPFKTCSELLLKKHRTGELNRIQIKRVWYYYE